MIIARILIAAKCICVLLMLAFPGQVVLDQAGDAGFLQSVVHHDGLSKDPFSSTPEESPDTDNQDHCCCAGLDFHPYVESLAVWPEIQGQAFPLWNDVLPDGPIESIEQPPQIS